MFGQISTATEKLAHTQYDFRLAWTHIEACQAGYDTIK
jgi:hypothetical protein